MAGTHLNISLIQPDIIWEDRDANLKQYTAMIDNIQEKKEVVVLPEMFTTGFSMSPANIADTMDGPAVNWMKETAAKNRCIITGSLIIKEEGKYYNRLLWVQPNGVTGQYDKRHLFAYAGEDEKYTPGDKRLIAQVNGFKVCLMVCYDLRFPVWARNKDAAYDVLIYVANWPEVRNLAWKTLLQARAIENLSYVVGVNRVGIDANGIKYKGESSAFGPLGEPLWQDFSGNALTQTITIEKKHVDETRAKLPFLNDADSFVLL